MPSNESASATTANTAAPGNSGVTLEIKGEKKDAFIRVGPTGGQTFLGASPPVPDTAPVQSWSD